MSNKIDWNLKKFLFRKRSGTTYYRITQEGYDRLTRDEFILEAGYWLRFIEGDSS